MISKKAKKARTKLLNMLWESQHKKGYISGADIRKIAHELDMAIVEVEGVVSFYHFFHTKPTGRFTIYLNNGIISDIKGFDDVKKALELETGATFGGVDATGTFGLFETSCIGLCDQEPAALINFYPFVDLTPKKVKRIIGQLKKRIPIEEVADSIENKVHYDLGPKSVFFKPYEQGRILRKALRMTPGEIIEELKWSGLSGRGGAFFPTGLKWDLCRKAMGYQKYVICNADEGEPGTFKDRLLLSEHIGPMLEGMIMAGHAIGASKGIIYLRGEYHYLKDNIQKEIEAFYQLGMLGEGVMGNEDFDFDIRIQMGAGAYICGEETALIESLEGKRGEPRTRTFFPVEKGLLFKPTLVNNVETYVAAARILEMGAPVYKALGTLKSSGTKLLSVSGDCEKPGIYEIEWGMTINELLGLCGANDTQFIQWTGPSGNLLSKEDFDTEISGEGLICGGAVMIFNSKRKLWNIIQNFSNFFINESCGLCTPCRAGNYLIGEKLAQIKNGKGVSSDIDDIKAWAHIIKATSRCGLGRTSNNYLLDAFDKFPKVLKQNLKGLGIEEYREFSIEESQIDYADFVMKTSRNG